MARLRTLKPTFFTHELLCELSPLHRILFEGLWCWADRDGRLEDRPRFLKTVVLPYDTCDIDPMLWDLAERGFIVRYEVDGVRAIDIPAFLAHQKPHPREAPSKIRPPEFGTVSKREVPRMAQPEHNLGVAQAQPRSDPGKTKVLPEQDLGLAEPGCLGDICLGDFGLGEAAPTPGSAKVVLPEARPSSQKKPASDYRELTDSIYALFLEVRGVKYEFQKGPDGPALSWLQKQERGEVERRWRRGLELGNKWPGVATIAQLRSRWNELAPQAQAPPTGLFRQKRVAAEDNVHSADDIGRDLIHGF